MTPSFKCPKCGMVSYNANDIREGYCGMCHDWTFTPPDATVPRNQLGQRLAPGLWVDREGHAHWSILELLQEFELEDTPQHRAIVTGMITNMLRKAAPQITIVQRQKPD